MMKKTISNGNDSDEMKNKSKSVMMTQKRADNIIAQKLASRGSYMEPTTASAKKVRTSGRLDF